MNVIPWTARSFDQEIPVEYSPMILERLRGTPARLEERLGGLAPDILTRRDGDRWSIQENVGHLLDVESLWAGRLDDYMNGEEELRAADISNRRTNDARAAESAPLTPPLDIFLQTALASHLYARTEPYHLGRRNPYGSGQSYPLRLFLYKPDRAVYPHSLRKA